MVSTAMETQNNNWYNRCYRREEFLENYAEIHGLPSPGRNVNRITQSLTLLPAETSYKSVYRDFIAGLENNNALKLLKYDASYGTN